MDGSALGLGRQTTKQKVLKRPDKIRQLYYIFVHDTVMTDLALQVAEANRGGPGT